MLLLFSISNFVLDCCQEVKVCLFVLNRELYILSVGSKVGLICGYCLPLVKYTCIQIDFQVPRSRWEIVVCSVCLYFNSFIFLANITLRPEVIKLEHRRTEHRPQLLSCMISLYEQKLTISRSHQPFNVHLRIKHSSRVGSILSTADTLFLSNCLEWCGF